MTFLETAYALGSAIGADPVHKANGCLVWSHKTDDGKYQRIVRHVPKEAMAWGPGATPTDLVTYQRIAEDEGGVRCTIVLYPDGFYQGYGRTSWNDLQVFIQALVPVVPK